MGAGAAPLIAALIEPSAELAPLPAPAEVQVPGDVRLELDISRASHRPGWNAQIVFVINGKKHGGRIEGVDDAELLKFTHAVGDYLHALDTPEQPKDKAFATLGMVFT
jgi:hypothetical protein